MSLSYTKAKEIKTFIAVLGSSVSFAFILIFSMLCLYSRSGVYFSAYLLPIPESYGKTPIKPHAKHVTKEIASLSDLFFFYFDQNKNIWKKILIVPELYEQFYLLIQRDQSVVQLEESIKTQFSGSLSSLTMSLKAGEERALKDGVALLEDEKEGRSFFKSFTVQFLENSNYYRISSTQQSELEKWTYFYHEGELSLSEKIFKLFVLP